MIHRFKVSPELLIASLQTGHRFDGVLVSKGVPSDAKFVGAGRTDDGDLFIDISSMTYDEVKNDTIELTQLVEDDR